MNFWITTAHQLRSFAAWLRESHTRTAAAILVVIGCGAVLAAGPFFPLLDALLSKRQLASVTGALFLLLLSVSGRLLLDRLPETPQEKARRFHSDFTLDERLGVFTKAGAQGFFCPRCKGRLRVSRMEPHEQGWICPDATCAHVAEEPLRKPAMESPMSSPSPAATPAKPAVTASPASPKREIVRLPAGYRRSWR